MRLTDATLSIEQDTPLPADGLAPETRGNIGHLEIAHPSGFASHLHAVGRGAEARAVDSRQSQRCAGRGESARTSDWMSLASSGNRW